MYCHLQDLGSIGGMFVLYYKASRSATDEEGASRCHLIRGLRSKSYLSGLHNALHILHLPLHAHLP